METGETRTWQLDATRRQSCGRRLRIYSSRERHEYTDEASEATGWGYHASAIDTVPTLARLVPETR